MSSFESLISAQTSQREINSSVPASSAPNQSATQSSAGAALIDRMVREPWKFDFFSAVRRMENLYSSKPPVGHSARAADDLLRFGQSPSVAFAPATLGACEAPRDGKPLKMLVQFFGLFGPWGPLPLHLTEYFHQREKHFNDVSGIRFFDLFHHRLTSLFYRAWAANQQTVSYERGVAQGTNRPEIDRFSIYVASVTGRGMASFRNRDALPDLAKLSFVGLISQQSKSADGLASILKGYFELPAQIEQFVGHWAEIPEESQCRLGQSPETATLGLTTIVGRAVWDCQQKFRIRIGPMGFARYEYFLPGRQGLKRLQAIVRNYIGDEMEWDMQLILRAEEVPTTCLGKMGQLGWTTWIGQSVRHKQAENLILEPAA